MCTYLHTVDWRIGCPDLAAYCLAISLQFLPWLIFLKSIGLSKGTTSCNSALAISVTPAESKQDFNGVTHLTINWLTSEQKLAPLSNFSWIARGSVMKRFFKHCDELSFLSHCDAPPRHPHVIDNQKVNKSLFGKWGAFCITICCMICVGINDFHGWQYEYNMHSILTMDHYDKSKMLLGGGHSDV